MWLNGFCLQGELTVELQAANCTAPVDALEFSNRTDAPGLMKTPCGNITSANSAGLIEVPGGDQLGTIDSQACHIVPDYSCPKRRPGRTIPGSNAIDVNPSAVRKFPPAISVLSNTVTVRTCRSVPVPRGVQDEPSQAATLFAGAPPAESNSPPAISEVAVDSEIIRAVIVHSGSKVCPR